MTDALPAILLSRLLDDSMDAVIIIDDHCHIRYLNGAMQKLSGYGGGELLGQDLDGLLPDSLGAHHTAYVNGYIEANRVSSVLGKVRTFAIRHRDGHLIPIEMKSIDLGHIGGRRYFGAFMLDVRAQRAMEEKNASLLAQLEQQAMCDALTGLPNRRAFEAAAAQAQARIARSSAPLTVGVADIDHFKSINDQYGHAAGDAVLRAVSQAIREAGRLTDMAARLGGEEFGLLFPDATLEQAVQIAQRVRRAVAATRTTAPDGTPLAVTISIGLAKLAPGGSFDGALSDADKALYRAKHGGRDRVATAPLPHEAKAAPLATP
ncbi:GGDEF domain-containing protein [Janthinobacterium fluminis]|uniref:diguanylate cyclase n=1 Tax=Janthinobacterium fluminis TaxID=2987524 RepID=A0ABT5K3M2_9BURK|nr:sensor domain-containing diguanylate cyclase [Janthinobacterium fluminis]MDC8759479.1 sensor domain-containing diguanylate cyclase [Janthinobacterium fluminis]